MLIPRIGRSTAVSRAIGWRPESLRDRGVLVGGCIPRIVHERSCTLPPPRSAHDRFRRRVSRAAPPPASCRHAATSVAAPRRHRSTRSVSENLESWLEWRDRAERPVPGHVEEELRGYLECGILCFGFGRALCTGCGQGFVIAFSCKGRGVCLTRLSRARQPEDRCRSAIGRSILQRFCRSETAIVD
jgi:hypothetical protein